MTRWGLQTTTAVVDNFNRANETPLGAPWSLWYDYGNSMNLVSGEIQPSGGWVGITRQDIVFADGEVFTTVTQIGGIGADLYLRILPDFGGGYGLGVDNDLDLLYIWRADLIGSPVLDSIPHVAQDGYRYKLRAAGDQISAYVDSGSGWEEVMEVTDTAYPGAGFVTLDADVGMKLDNYGGGELAPSLWAPDTDDRWELTLA